MLRSMAVLAGAVASLLLKRGEDVVLGLVGCILCSQLLRTSARFDFSKWACTSSDRRLGLPATLDWLVLWCCPSLRVPC